MATGLLNYGNIAMAEQAGLLGGRSLREIEDEDNSLRRGKVPFDNSTNSIKTVFDKIGINFSDTESVENLSRAFDTLAMVEYQFMIGDGCTEYAEDGKTCIGTKGTTKNPVFKNSSFNTALNRIRNFYADNNLGPVPEAFNRARNAQTPIGFLSSTQQKELALIDGWYKLLTDPLFIKMAKGGKEGEKAIDDYYLKYHLTTAFDGSEQAKESKANREKEIAKTYNPRWIYSEHNDPSPSFPY